MNPIKEILKIIVYIIFFPIAATLELIRALSRYIKCYLKLALFYQRKIIIRSLADRHLFDNKKPKVLAVIAHVTSMEEANGLGDSAYKTERLQQTIDGLLNSLAHCKLTIVIHTVSQRSITKFLPTYQQEFVQVKEIFDCDPMFIGYKAQEEFSSQIDEFDWFIFLEDDIVINDSFILEKLENFSQNCDYPWAILVPNRYEFYCGRKNYIDLIFPGYPTEWNRLSKVDIDGISFAECTKPHSGFYGLTRSQMQHWIESDRTWKYRVISNGPRESSATFSPFECFSIFKPHPLNLGFFEVRHWDTKYSKLHTRPSPYSFSVMDRN